MNALLKQIKDAKQQGYEQGVIDGKEFALCLLTVALNEKYHFGGDRIAEIEAEMQRLWDEEFKDDPESGARHLLARLKQIRGVKSEMKKEGDNDKPRKN